MIPLVRAVKCSFSSELQCIAFKKENSPRMRLGDALAAGLAPPRGARRSTAPKGGPRRGPEEGGGRHKQKKIVERKKVITRGGCHWANGRLREPDTPSFPPRSARSPNPRHPSSGSRAASLLHRERSSPGDVLRRGVSLVSWGATPGHSPWSGLAGCGPCRAPDRRPGAK